MNYVKVYVEHSALSLNQLFTYSCDKPVEPGCRVIVPFGPRELTGFVASLVDQPDTDRKILPVVRVLDETPLLNEELFELAGWLADQCCASVISVLKTMLPPAMRPASGKQKVVLEDWLYPVTPETDAALTRKQDIFLRSLTLPIQAAKARKQSVSMTRSLLEKGYLTLRQQPKDRDVVRIPEPDSPPELQPFQKQAIDRIQQSDAGVFLLHGVTGSGKTEVFLRLAQDALDQGRQVLFLVPEIGLTPMMTERVMARFQDQIAVYHSYLSPQEKYAQYQRVREGKVKIVVGTRSACFMPFSNLGLILMDEEHDASYKQDSMPRYHTRDVVLHRSVHHGCKAVLASATPSLESYARTLKHVYELVELPERIHKRMPEIQLVDMRTEPVISGFSRKLLDAIQSRLEKQEQTILLLNRRGYLPVVRCADCQDVRICPDCGIALSYHKKENRLVCHSCERSFRYDPVCPACGSPHAAMVGMGTEKLEETLQELFPQARIVRMDADSTRKKGAHKALLDEFGKGADILVGTQMVAKGLDFPNVTLVGVLQADNALIRTDYRAAETAYEMLEQASGRSGRGKRPGEVLIQTFDPAHYVLQAVKNHDYQGFFRQEMQYRHLGNYPPYTYMAMVVFSHEKPEKAMDKAQQAAEMFREQRVLGPVTISMRRQKHRVRLLIKDKDPARLCQAVWQMVHELDHGAVKLDVTMHPLRLED